MAAMSPIASMYDGSTAVLGSDRDGPASQPAEQGDSLLRGFTRIMWSVAQTMAPLHGRM
jgi:hypothetical protein